MTITTEDILKLKKPKVRVPIHPLLAERFSPRMYSDEIIPDDIIASFFEAARWAPSSYNRQPWYFYYAKKGTEGFEKIASCLSEANYWAKKAPLLIVACYINEDDKGVNESAKYDLGQAVMSLSIQAQFAGYYTHQMGGFDKTKAKEILQISDPVFPLLAISIGKIGDYLHADEYILGRDVKEKERKENIGKEMNK